MGLVYNAITPSGTNRCAATSSYRFRRTPFSAYPVLLDDQPRNSENKPQDVGQHRDRVGGRPDRQGQGALLRRVRAHVSRPVGRRSTSMPALVAAVGQPQQPNTVPAYQSVRFFLGKLDYQLAPGSSPDDPRQLVREQQPVQRRRRRHDHDRARLRLQGRDELHRRRSSCRTGDQPPERAAGAVRAAALPAPVARGRARGHLGDASRIAISFGHPTSDGEDFVQGITQVIDNFTLIRGSHSYKHGFDFQYVARHARRAADLGSTRSRPSTRIWRRRPASPRRLHDLHPGDRRSRLQDGQPAVQRLLCRTTGALTPRPQVPLRTPLRCLLLPGRPTRRAVPYSQNYRDDTNNFGPRFGLGVDAGREQAPGHSRQHRHHVRPAAARRVYENAIQHNGLPAHDTYSVNRHGAGAPAFPNTLSNLPPAFTLPRSRSSRRIPI